MSNHVIYDRIWKSRKLSRCSLKAALAYPWLYLAADDWGRFEYDPRAIWGEAFATRQDVRVADVVGWLAEFQAVGLMVRYQIGDRDICQWTKFAGPPPSRRRAATLPGPDGTVETEGLKARSRFQSAASVQQARSNVAASVLPSGFTESGSRKQEAGSGKQEAEVAAPAPPADAEVRPGTADGLAGGAQLAPLPADVRHLEAYCIAWRERWGQESKPSPRAWSASLAEAEQLLGVPETVARWVRYLASEREAKWCRADRFLEGLGQYGVEGVAPAQPVGLAGRDGQQALRTPRQQRERDAIEAAMLGGLRPEER